MTKLRIGMQSEATTFGLHYVIGEVANNNSMTGVDGVGFPINFQKFTDMLTHHMAEFEKDAGNLVIDGYVIPKKVYARACIDTLYNLLANHDITTNLALVRVELCNNCNGLGEPAQEFVENQPLTPGSVTHGRTS